MLGEAQGVLKGSFVVETDTDTAPTLEELKPPVEEEPTERPRYEEIRLDFRDRPRRDKIQIIRRRRR